jgi:hypothetical protein
MGKIIIEVDQMLSSLIEIRRPSWNDMYKFYPNSQTKTIDLYETIGGGLLEYYKNDPNSWENSCAIRMSKALNYSGVVLPNAPSKGGTIIGKDKNKYWIRVMDLKKYLYELFHKPDIEEKAGPNAVDKFKEKKGIIVFEVSGWGNASGHFTLWDGKHLIYPGNPNHDDPNSIYYYFNMRYSVRLSNNRKKEVKTQRILLWELK